MWQRDRPSVRLGVSLDEQSRMPTCRPIRCASQQVIEQCIVGNRESLRKHPCRLGIFWFAVGRVNHAGAVRTNGKAVYVGVAGCQRSDLLGPEVQRHHAARCLSIIPQENDPFAIPEPYDAAIAQRVSGPRSGQELGGSVHIGS